MKIAITGASGHLGSAIIPELINRNYEVKALVRDSRYTINEFPVEIVRGSLSTTESLQELMKDCDALIHSAAVISINGDPDGIVHQTNVEGTKLIMETAKRSGIKRVIHISSIHAYEQRPRFALLDEQRELVNDKAFAYDRSKKEGQAIALSMNHQGMEVLVMNPTSIIGPFDFKPSKMGKVIIDLYNGHLPFIFNAGFDFCDCRDVANAIVNGLTMGTPGECYLLGGKWYSFKQLTSILSKAAGKKLNKPALPLFLGYIGLPFIKALGWLTHQEPIYTNEALFALQYSNKMISSNKAQQQLNYHRRHFEETITDTFNWFKQNGYLV